MRHSGRFTPTGAIAWSTSERTTVEIGKTSLLGGRRQLVELILTEANLKVARILSPGRTCA